MSGSDAVVTLRIRTDTSGAAAGVEGVRVSVVGVGAAAEGAAAKTTKSFDSIGSSSDKLREQIQGVQTALVAMAGLHFGGELVRDIVDANNKLQGWRFGLEAATGSSRAASEALSFVRAESDRLGISLEDSATTFTRLAAATKNTALEGAGAQKVFTAVAEASRTLHLSGAETQQALLALDQMMSKGTVQAQELKLQLGNVLPGAMHIAADAIGVTTAQFDKMMERGQIVSEEFLPKLAARLHELYGATAAEAANSPAAQLERLKNAAFELKAAIGDAGFMSTLASKAQALTAALTALVKSGSLDLIVRGLIAIGEGMVLAFAVEKIAAIKTLVTNMMLARVAIEGAAEAQAGLNIAMNANVIGIVAIAIAGLYEGYKYLTEQQEKHTQQIKAEVAELDKATESLRRYHQELTSTSAGLGDLDKISKSYIDTSALLAQKQAELAKKKKELADAEKELAAAQYVVSIGMDETGVGLLLAQQRVEKLRAEIKPTEEATQNMAAALAALGVDLRNVAPFVDDLTERFGQLRNAATLGGAIGAAKNVVADFFKTIRAMAADKESKTLFDGLAAQAKSATEETEKLRLGTVGYARAQQQRALADLEARGASQAAIAQFKRESDANIASIAENERVKDAKKHHRDATKELEQAEKSYSDKLATLVAIESKVDAAQSARAAATDKFRATIIAISKAENDYIAAADKAGKGDLARQTVAQIDGKLKQDALDTLQRTNAENERAADIIGNLTRSYSDDIRVLTLSNEARAEEEAVVKETAAAYKLYKDGRRDSATLTAAEEAQVRALARSHYEEVDAINAARQSAQDYANIWRQTGDGLAQVFSNVLVHGGSLFKGLKDLAKSTMESIIQYFAKLAVINPILNAVFGRSSGWSTLPEMFGGGQTSLAQTGAALLTSGSGTGGGGVVGAIGSLFGGGSDGASGSSGGGFDWKSGASWIQAGKSLWNGFSNGFSSLWNGPQVPGITGMTADANGIYRASYGNVSPGVDMSYGGYSSGFTQALGVAGGVYAGYQRAQNADGAFGKVGGGLAYGVGTYYAGAAVSAALAGGVSAGLAAIPVVGWIALAAMLVDKFSGGKLFGTSYHPESATGAIKIGADGGTATATVKEVKQQALFGGRKWRESSVDPGDEARDAAAQFFTAIKQAMTAAANATGDELAPVIDASIRTVTEYDKKGRVTATKYFSDVLGKTWEEATAELAAKRVQAEAIIKQVDVSAHGAASALADQFRADAEKLFDASQFVLAAQADINKHLALLGDTSTLAATLDITKQLQQADETLVQTYARLQTETQALRESLALTGADIGKTGADFVKFADSAAIAAGGVDKLQALMQSFAQAFYSADEIAAQQVANLAKARDAALAALGLDAGTTREQFRALYEAALPTMTPQQLVQWQQAGVLLGQAADALKAYNDQVAQNAATVKSILTQINPGGDPAAGTWATTLANINASYDTAIEKMRAAGATVDELAQAEQFRADAIAKAQQDAADNYDAIVSQLRTGLDQLNGIAGESQLQQALDAITKAETDTIAQLEAAAKAAGKQGAAESDLALVHQYAAAQADAARKQAADQATEFLQSLGIMSGGVSDFGKAMAAIDAQAQQARDAMNLLAQSQGRAGASTVELARVEMWAADQRAKLTAQLQAQAQDYISQLYGGMPGTLDEINRRISELQASSTSFGDAAGGAASAISDATQTIRDRVRLMIGDLSPYNDNQKLDIAKKAYLEGNASADDVLNIARRLFASSADYKGVFDWVMSNTPQVASTGGSAGGNGVDHSAELAKLYAERDKIIAEQAAAQRKEIAEKLTQSIADLAAQNHVDALTQMAFMGVKLESLVADLGIDLRNITDSSVTGLARLADTLHLQLGDLLTALHLNFGDLETGFLQLSTKLGIDLTNLSDASVKSLGDLAGMLHIRLEDVIDALHLSLADIGPGLREIAEAQGIRLDALVEGDAAKLQALADTLHISLADLVSALHISLDSIGNSIAENTRGIGVDIGALVTARTAGDRDLGVRFDGLARAVVDNGNGDVVAELRGVRQAVERTAVTSEQHLPNIDWSTDNTERNTSRAADAAESTAADIRSSFVPSDRSVRP